eukprot:Gregarina_sp_Poly_1__3453@NODE_19_length_21533_cov_161_091167_g17_i0_p4_GENE_NODE_19_length_21533_cov_161_091167_g17_i0NODE_19_length_21533_cov_161_091167_g17_i0_p4_ORF_typecomplete_len518_score69_55Myb_DNAbind_6/PF13921_6/0_52Myb_DNAbind_6/PF13921_6/0_0012Myb_DNAbind_6/PF13921_6/0_13Myb_DNAbinding/PF00249_31/2_5e03Myb_DNAbinding/PF00249_31/0_12Myb_DNAbinding/PF00249_31/0_35Myb_DNAbinding/PF00249_31/13Radial_spoke_3/PF06098_11/4_4e02Radial_spoke_3/PF06098_11/1_1_NODE_19_length_21533_cov_161_0911
MSLRLSRRHKAAAFRELGKEKTSKNVSPPTKRRRVEGSNRTDAYLEQAWEPVDKFKGKSLRVPSGDIVREVRSWHDLKNSENRVIGKFSSAEDQLIRERLNHYFDLQGLSWDDGLRKLVNLHGTRKHRKSKEDESSPWVFIAACLPDRHIESIIQHVQSSIYQWPKKGKWDEVDTRRLVILHRKYNNDWKRIGCILQRYWRTCSDRFKSLQEKNLVDYYEQLAIAAGEQDSSTFETTDADNFKICLEATQTCAPSSAASDTTEDVKPNKRPSRRFFTPEEDNCLLSIIQKISSTPFPLKMVPWTTVQREFTKEFPEVPASSAALRMRYISTLLPRSGCTVAYYAMMRRNIWRFLSTLLARNPKLHWSEIQWSTVLPHWGAARCASVAKQTIVRCAGGAAADPALFEGNAWKPYVKWLYSRTACDENENADARALSEYLAAIKKFNGEDPENPALPLDAREERMRNYTRRRMAELRREKVRKRDMEEEKEAAAISTSELEYLEERLLMALDRVGISAS